MAQSSGGGDDEKILSYGDVVLRRSDLQILRGPLYINDRLLDFFFSHLSSSSGDRVLLVPSSISFWISNCPDATSLRDVVRPLDLPRKDLVLFTVNDNSDFDLAEGGSHWSLLVFHRKTKAFVHHDSSYGMNKWHARRLYEAVKRFVVEKEGEGVRFIEGPTPQQENGFDCGLYVMGVARVVCEWYEGGGGGGGDWWFSDVEEKVDVGVDNLRMEVLELILKLMKQK